MTEQENIDHFKRMLKEDPSSKAFAPLAESYRKLGQLEKALQIALDGVAVHPHFNSGKVALAKILIDLKKFPSAEQLLKEVCNQDFDNLLAHRLLGEVHIHTGKLELALESFKAALLANPMDKISQAMVNKLESVSAKTFSPSVFKNLPRHEALEQKTIRKKELSLHSALSYIDVLITRKNYHVAQTCTDEHLLRFPGNPELQKRKNYLSSLKAHNPSISREEALSKPELTKNKLEALYKAVESIDEQLKKRPELYKS